MSIEIYKYCLGYLRLGDWMEGKVRKIMIATMTLMLPMLWGSVIVSADPPEMWLIEPEGIVYEGDTITIKWDCPAWTVRMEMRAYLSFEGRMFYLEDKIFETETEGMTLTEGYENIDVPIQDTGRIEHLQFWLSCFNSEGVETQEQDGLFVYSKPDVSEPDGDITQNDNLSEQNASSIYLPVMLLFIVLSIILLVAVVVLARRGKGQPPQQNQE